MTTYPAWIFDGSEIPDPFGYGQRAVDFLRVLKHPKSLQRGKAFELNEWQERIVRRIYGPCHPDGRRIVRNVYMLLPRGNRKTSLGAALALLHTIGPERIDGGQVNVAASDRKQARIAYEEATGIIRADPRIASRMKVLNAANRLVHPKSGAVFEALSADAGTQHGRTPNFALADELHAWKKRELWDVIRTGLVKVRNSLLVVITTAGRGQQNIAWESIEYARKVARGEIDDPATLPILFETPADADWRDEDVWYRANPGLPLGYPDIEGLRQEAREAENKPGSRDAFRQLYLNVWLDHSTSPFVEMAVYDEGADSVDETELENEPCWIAVDASVTTDLTAVVACFPDEDEGHRILAWFFVPEENLRARADRDGVPYPRWAEEGFIIPTPGNVIDYRAVEQFLRELFVRFDVREIAFDPAYARQISVPLAEDGFPVVEMRQGWRTMAPAIAELERVIIGGQFHHGGNPVLRWCFDNVAVEVDKAGNKSFHKGKSKDRIDGAIAAAMAVARATEGDSGRSVYADAAARPEGLLVF